MIIMTDHVLPIGKHYPAGAGTVSNQDCENMSNPAFIVKREATVDEYLDQCKNFGVNVEQVRFQIKFDAILGLEFRYYEIVTD